MTDEVNCKLIDLVHSKPCIYDKTDVYYSNKEHVKLMWQEIANSMQLPVPVCQKRWRYLRDYFVRQLHMTQNDQKKSYWALYDRMLFLKPFSTTRKIRLSLNDNDNQRNSRKRNQSTKSLNIVESSQQQQQQQQYYNDQNSTTPILSISSGGNSGDDEFNSFDYLNLYQAQFGLADDIALQQKLNEEHNEDHKQQDFYQQQNKLLQKENEKLKIYEIEQNSCKNSTNEPQILLEELNDSKISNENNNNNIKFNKNYINENLVNNSVENENNYIYPNLPILLEKPDNENSITSSQDYFFDETKNTFEKYETNSIFDDNFNVPLMLPPRKRIKKSDLMEEMLSVIKNNTNEPDEHEYFFKSLLPNVRKIDDDLIMSFRSEILQLCIKYKYMSQQQNCDSISNSNININNQNNNNIDYDGENSELIVIDTGESDWRKKLKNRF